MSYLTVEVRIDHGRIVARELEKVPEKGNGFLTMIVGLVGGLLFGAINDVDGAALAQPPYPKTNLTSFLLLWKPTPASLGTICELEPQWVGTIKRAYLRGGEDIYEQDQPNNVRFSYLVVSEDWEGRIDLGLRRGLGSWSLPEAPAFMTNLPSAKAVAEAKNVDDLRKMFGPQHDRGSDRTESWTWFTAEGKDKLRYLGVFAHVSGRDKPTDIDILHITEGFFRPANPNSAVERAQFKTGEEVEAEYEASRVKARAKYPLPLRALVEARETPGDHDLNACKRALNEIRRNPSPELFRQFAEWFHEGTCEIQQMLEQVLFDDYLKLEKWQEPQRSVSLRALADALPDVKTTMDLDRLVCFLLQAHGGGELTMNVSGTNARIKVTGHRMANGAGRSFSTGSNVSEEDLARAAEQCRQALKERYPGLR